MKGIFLRIDQYRALHEGAGFLERTDSGRLWLRGADRRAYLHGILTNDIAGLSAGAGAYAALLTPQGRMITDMHVHEQGEAVLVMLPRSLAGAIRDRLDQFIFSEDVLVEDVTDRTVQFGVYGPRAADVVAGLDGAVPSRQLGVDGFELVADAGQAESLRATFAARGAIEVSPETMEVCRIESGIPRFLADMTTETIPLEAGIEDRAISMTKGCYPGQEVIVRVLHRGGGRVAKKLVGLRFAEGVEPPAPGQAIRSGEREVGLITSAALSPRLGRAIALGYVHRDFTAPGTVVTVAEAGGEVTALPF